MSSDTVEHKEHILPVSLYLNIGLILFILTGITVWVSFYHFGAYNLLVAMIIAATKATLVALFFMHLKYDNKLYLFIFLSAIFFLAVFIIITMFDTLNRGDIDQIKEFPINKEAVIYQKKADTTNSFVDSLSIKSDTVSATVESTGH